MTLRGTACAVKKRACVSPRTLAFCYMSIFITVLFFRNAQAASVWVTEGLELCVTKLIPSLFPFMVVSALLIKSGVGRTVFSVLSRPMRALFGIGADSSCALALGWLCGFPVEQNARVSYTKTVIYQKRNTALCFAFLVRQVLLFSLAVWARECSAREDWARYYMRYRLRLRL